MKACEHRVFAEAVGARFRDPVFMGAGRPLLLMVSGGSDSVALLHLACAAREKGNALRACAQEGSASATNTAGKAHDLLLRVLHVNHTLRGTEADEDECYVVELCKALAVPCVVKRADVAAIAAETKDSLEQTGRRLRYELAEEVLDTWCKELGTAPAEGRIATAHTADDRAETLLQRLIVGGGGGSLGSIPWSNGRIRRPLLGNTHRELQDYLTTLGKRNNGHLWREDATNLDTTYSRAFVRHTLLPLLKGRNPRILESLNRTATVLSDESLCMDEQAREFLPLSTATFRAPLPLLRRAVYLACTEALETLAPRARITFEHIELIVREGNRAGFACQIPGGVEVRNKRGKLEFYKAKPPQHDPRKNNAQSM